MQDHSGAAKVPGLDREGWPQAPPRPAPMSSLPGHQPKAFSSRGSVSSGSDADDRASKPSPLCEALVLNVKSRYRLPFLGLGSAKGTVPILSESSNKLLLMASVEVDPANKGGIVSLTLTDSNTLLGSIKSEGTGIMSIADRRGAVYGQFQYVGNLEYRLTTGGKPVAALHFVQAANAEGHMHLTAINGVDLADASKCTDESKGGKPEDYLEVKVTKGMDSVLALLCIMGATLLG